MEEAREVKVVVWVRRWEAWVLRFVAWDLRVSSLRCSFCSGVTTGVLRNLARALRSFCLIVLALAGFGEDMLVMSWGWDSRVKAVADFLRWILVSGSFVLIYAVFMAILFVSCLSYTYVHIMRRDRSGHCE